MKTIEKHGSDIEQIIAQFKVENNLTDSDFTYEVIREAQKGLLGFIGRKDAIVVFKTDTIVEDLASYVRELAVLMRTTVGQVRVTKDDKYIYVFVDEVAEPGFLIGKNGRLMETLQYLINQTFSKKDVKDRKIILDIEGYKERQEQQLYKKVQYLAEQALRNHKSITLEPMSAPQRRIVHEVARKYDKLRTMTIGEGAQKRVVLNPSNRRHSG